MSSDLNEKKGLSRLFNYRFVCSMMGRLCLFQLPLLLICGILAVYYHDSGLNPILQTVCVMTALGLVLMGLGRSSHKYSAGRREGMITVALCWFVISLVGMLPYWLGGYVPTVADAFFEAISGFTTTGATVIADVESLPKSVLFWRSLTQWEGGLGIVVFAVAFLPVMGSGAAQLFVSETTGITHERFVPRTGTMAKWLVVIYLILTLVCALLFWLGPMDLYEAVSHAATCLSTGGFSTRNASLGAFQSDYIETIATIFMILGATNFSVLYFTTIRKDRGRLWKDTEFRWFLGIIVVLTLIVSIWLVCKGIYTDFGGALFDSLVQIVSLITTTGYTITDFDVWLTFFGMIGMFAMFISGCAGSTSGGLKTIRFVILLKYLMNELRKRTHPSAVIPVRINHLAIPGRVVHQVLIFFFAYLSLVYVCAIVVSLEGYSVEESLFTAISCISNSGPDVGKLGPTENFGVLSAHSKVILSLLMVTGRLEIFTVVTLFHPGFWKH